ncbi:MAG: chorismate-binding protein [Candidatus Poseidonia sp.]|nr:chorismate-binding protein [Poseidonia sp.]
MTVTLADIQASLLSRDLLGSAAFRHGSSDAVILHSGGPASHLARWSLIAAPPRLRVTVRQPSRDEMPAAQQHSPLNGELYLNESNSILRGEVEEWKHGCWYHKVTLLAKNLTDLMSKLQPLSGTDEFSNPVMDEMPKRPFWSGALAYDLVQWTQPLRLQHPPEEGALLAVLWYVERGVIQETSNGNWSVFGTDEWTKQATLAMTEPSVAQPIKHPNTYEEHTDHTKETHMKNIERVREGIIQGQVYQVNIGNHWSGNIDHPYEIFTRLCVDNPAPYSAYIEAQDIGFALVCSSPESLLQCNQKTLRTSPIKGTCTQGMTETEAAEHRQNMLGDEKERAEHRMLVDLMRNDISAVSEVGSVSVDRFDVESYANVQHLVSHITGVFQEGKDGIQALNALFPGGSITGCPRTMVCAVIDELEQRPRSFWTGSLGWVDVHTGEGSWNILIRTLEAHRSGSVWTGSIGAGGGITIASNAEREVAEATWKGAALRVASGWMQPETLPLAKGPLGIHPIEHRTSTKMSTSSGNILSLAERQKQGSDCGVLFIDNLDSFSYNIANVVAESGYHVTMVQGRTQEADRLADPVALFDFLDALQPSHLILGPGPGTPSDAPLTMACAHHAIAGQLKIPVLGICLGHQALALADGMEVLPSPQGPVHGVPCQIEHNGRGLYNGMENPLSLTRYNSLVAMNPSINKTMEITATECHSGLIMGLAHPTFPIHGFQYHPESVGSSSGEALIHQFLKIPSDG